jgi:predicted kinase
MTADDGKKGQHRAYRLLHPVSCIVVGVPASGKTTLALELARSLDSAAYLSKDMLQSPFTGTERVEGSTYSLISRPTFQTLVNFTDIQLSLGKIPVIDAPFSINHWRGDSLSDWITPFRTVAEKRNARLAVIRCVPPGEDALRARIEKRNLPRDGWKLEHWQAFLEREPMDFPIDHGDTCRVVTDRPATDLVQDLLRGFLKAVCRE